MNEERKEHTHQHVRRNFWLTVGNGGFVIMGTSFIAADTVLAGLTYELTQSNICVGLLTSLVAVGWMWPQLLVGNLVESVHRKKPFYVFSAMFRFAASLCMGAVIYFWRGNDMGLYWAVLLLMVVFSSGGGTSVVPFMDIVGKAIPQRDLAMLWAYRRLFGGILGFAVGGVVAYILSEESGMRFPANYALLCFLSTVLCGMAYVMFTLVREPIEPVVPDRLPFLTFLKRGPVILKRDRDFRRLYIWRWVWALGGMSQALFVPFAMDQLDAPAKQAGWFTAVVMLVGGLSSYVWGRVCQRRGEVYTLRMSAMFLLISPLLALFTMLCAHTAPFDAFIRAHSLWPLLLMFAFGTAALNGNLIAGMAYLLSLPAPPLRPSYIGFINTLSIPLLCAPTLAGFVAEHMSYQAVFATSCVAALVAVFMAGSLRERRHGGYPDLGLDEMPLSTTEGPRNPT